LGFDRLFNKALTLQLLDKPIDIGDLIIIMINNEKF